MSVAETAPYFYNGLAQTLDQVLDGTQDGNGVEALITDTAGNEEPIRGSYIVSAEGGRSIVRKTLDGLTLIESMPSWARYLAISG